MLKENGTEIFGRVFIALIAQTAQERATRPENKRLPTFVYVDEAADYFDRNIGVILSQARKYNVGMILAHQYLGQLDPKLHEHGPLSSVFLHTFSQHIASNEKRARDRLTDLFIETKTPHRDSYLDRPMQRFRTLDARYQALVYEFAPAGRGL